MNRTDLRGARPRRLDRVVITGGAGFLGSHLCTELVARGTHVVCLDNFVTGSPANVAHLEGSDLFDLRECDVTELVINRPGEVGVEGVGGWRWHEAPELTPAWLATLGNAAAAFTRQDVNAETPICSTVLPQGERCQIVLPPAVPADTVSITIRKPSSVTFGMDDFTRNGLFEVAKAATDELDETEEELLRLRDAGAWP